MHQCFHCIFTVSSFLCVLCVLNWFSLHPRVFDCQSGKFIESMIWACFMWNLFSQVVFDCLKSRQKNRTQDSLSCFSSVSVSLAPISLPMTSSECLKLISLQYNPLQFCKNSCCSAIILIWKWIIFQSFDTLLIAF